MNSAIKSTQENRTKPNDNKELEAFEGLKVLSFFPCVVSLMIVGLTKVKFNNIQQAIKAPDLMTSQALNSHLYIDNFIFFSVFVMSYKTFQIVDERGGDLYIGDIFKIWMRKFVRLAIPYYVMWALLWSISS